MGPTIGITLPPERPAKKSRQAPHRPTSAIKIKAALPGQPGCAENSSPPGDCRVPLPVVSGAPGEPALPEIRSEATRIRRRRRPVRPAAGTVPRAGVQFRARPIPSEPPASSRLARRGRRPAPWTSAGRPFSHRIALPRPANKAGRGLAAFRASLPTDHVISGLQPEREEIAPSRPRRERPSKGAGMRHQRGLPARKHKDCCRAMGEIGEPSPAGSE